MKISDIKPQQVDFKACGVGLTFRPFVISDQMRMEDVFGDEEGLSTALKEFDFEKLSLLAWYQLDIRSQREVLKAVEGVYIDAESGKEIDAALTPIQKFRALFTGIADQMTLIRSLLNCRGLNMPPLDDAEKIKKWADRLAKLVKSTGQKSLT